MIKKNFYFIVFCILVLLNICFSLVLCNEDIVIKTIRKIGDTIFYFELYTGLIMLATGFIRFLYLRNRIYGWRKLKEKTQSTQTSSFSEYDSALFQIKTYLSKEDKASLAIATKHSKNKLFDSKEKLIKVTNNFSSNKSIEPFSVVSIFAIGVLTQLPIHHILNYLITLQEISPLLSNPSAVSSLIDIYTNLGQAVPESLRQLAHPVQVLPNPEDYLLPGESILNPSSSKSILTGTFSSWKIGLVFVSFLGIGYGIYWYNYIY